MNYDNDTKTQQTSSGCTDITSVQPSERSYLLTKSQAHKLLNEVKAGVNHHPVLVTQALIATGDWILV